MSPSTLRRVSTIGAYLWLALSFQLFFVAFLAVILSPFALIYAVLGLWLSSSPPSF
jgi:hypothetical protein